MQRKQINLQIVDALRDYINKYPEQRFGQALRNIGIVDTVLLYPGEADKGVYFTNIFHEEPEFTLKRIMETLNERRAERKD
jgi:hypothetical protein